MACAALAFLLVFTAGITLFNQPTIPTKTNTNISVSERSGEFSILRAHYLAPPPMCFAANFMFIHYFTLPRLHTQTHIVEPISYGRTVARHITRDKGFLSYPSSAIVTVFSKQSYYNDNGAEFWEAEVKKQQSFFCCCLFFQRIIFFL